MADHQVTKWFPGIAGHMIIRKPFAYPRSNPGRMMKAIGKAPVIETFRLSQAPKKVGD